MYQFCLLFYDTGTYTHTYTHSLSLSLSLSLSPTLASQLKSSFGNKWHMLNHNLVWYGYSEIFFFVKHLKKIPTCTQNFVWISIPKKREELKEEDFLWSTWRKFLSVFEICEYLFPEKRRIFCEALEEKLPSVLFGICEYVFRKRGGFFMKSLKKIPKCTQNLWISIPKRGGILCIIITSFP